MKRHVFEIEVETADLSDVLSLLEERGVPYRATKTAAGRSEEDPKVLRPRFGKQRAAPFKHPSGLRARDFIFARLRETGDQSSAVKLDKYLVELGFARTTASSRLLELREKYEQPIVRGPDNGVWMLTDFGASLDRLPDEPQGIRQAILRRVASKREEA